MISLLVLIFLLTFATLFFAGSDGWIPAVVAAAGAAVVYVGVASISYQIEGDKLVVRTWFHPTAYPISEIAEISATKSALSAPAASFTDRIAIKFKSPKVMKSYLPLILSPVRRSEFLAELLAVNPSIKLIGLP